MTCIRLMALAGCLLAGSSATGTAACFYPRDVQSFRVLDRSNLIVYALNGSDAYRVRINPPTGLESAESLTFLPPDARICGYAGERLIIGRGPVTEARAVIDVSRLAPDSLAALLTGNADESLPAASPKPGPGAEVEAPKAQEGTEEAPRESLGKLDGPPER
jgi:hypothetical protein